MMTDSILSNERECYMCGSQVWLERHHIFGGAYRKKSERDGLWVYLCHYCHNTPPKGVHFNRDNMDWLRSKGEQAWLDYHNKTIPDFIAAYGRNYL